jgi:hypothetical protein
MRFDGHLCYMSPVFHSDDDEEAGREVTCGTGPSIRSSQAGTEIGGGWGLFHGVGILDSVEETTKHKHWNRSVLCRLMSRV